MQALGANCTLAPETLEFVRAALEEDLGPVDLTSEAVVDSAVRCRARLVARESGILSGITVFRTVFDILAADIRDWSSLKDGARFNSGDTVATFEGLAQRILSGERVALNIVQMLSGVATLTARYVEAVQGLNVRICDTRKTTPLMRSLEKQAVRHGGGFNHRFALYDGILIKENHIAANGSLTGAVQAAKKRKHHLAKVCVEVTSLDEFEEALAAGADVILLDNMPPDLMRKAVERAHDAHVLIEASGGIKLSNVRAIAETGVDIISIGALTHSAPCVDLSLLIGHV